MIRYFYYKYFKYQVNPVILKNSYVIETNPMFLTKLISKKKNFINATILFYSILSFYTWVRFIFNVNLSLLLIMENNNINLFKLLFNNCNLNVIAEDDWIPGLLSNSHEIKNGNRYIINLIEDNIRFKKNPDFIYLCSTRRPLISQEAYNQVIPQFTILLSISKEITTYYIPLFVPKWNTKNYNINKIKYCNFSTAFYYKIKIRSIQKYVIMAKLIKPIPHLIYLSFLLI